jgi:hypothetical protein
VQFDDPDYEGGAKEVSLRQGQKNFLVFGSCEERCIQFVRKPTDDDVRDPKKRRSLVDCNTAAFSRKSRLNGFSLQYRLSVHWPNRFSSFKSNRSSEQVRKSNIEKKLYVPIRCLSGKLILYCFFPNWNKSKLKCCLIIKVFRI